MKSTLASLILLSALVLGVLSAVSGVPWAAVPDRQIDFNRDVRPILAENCFACHGFDAAQRKAGLRLDTAEGATSKLPSGNRAVVPGKLEQSQIALRIEAAGPIQMPPAASGKKLTPAQIETLKLWIKQGGSYEEHWAFIPPTRPAVPDVKLKSWPQNPIDRFILARLEREGLKPSPPADRITLARRIYFDLTGLPPTPAEVDAFVNDTAPGAYERVVDRLIASPHFGERMALPWLDLARYADTHGYHIDSHREMWRWRDWVINAFNTDMPYDEFVTEQLAGDMLPSARLDQKIATGFNRNHPINFEGGAIPEEYAAAYIFDRIDTTSTAFLALTMRCGQCHDHKYDPITQKDFYRFYALFNNIPEEGLDGFRGNAKPFIKAPLPDQQARLDAFDKQIEELKRSREARVTATAAERETWEKAAVEGSAGLAQGLAAHFGLDESKGESVADSGRNLAGQIKGKAAWGEGQFQSALSFDGATHVEIASPELGAWDPSSKFSYGAWVNPQDSTHMTVLSRMDDANGIRGWDLYLGDGKVYVHLISKWEENAIRVNSKSGIEPKKWSHLFATYDGSGKAAGIRIYINGKPAELEITHDRLNGPIKADKPVTIGRRSPSAPFKGLIDEVRIYNRDLAPAEVAELAVLDPLRQIVGVPSDKRTAEQKDRLSRILLERNDPAYRSLTANLETVQKEREGFERTVPTVMVMQEMEEPRDTFMLIRGQYDKKGDKVTPGIPAVFESRYGQPVHNRLELAKWLTNPGHPLTSRVEVNRLWQMVFGAGLVRTAENFGIQGERPTHPELLDWLAVEFAGGVRDYGSDGALNGPAAPRPWDIKRLIRLIVTSATYRQASHVTPELLKKDPENRLLARGPRVRLPAEFVRDQALKVSGLLVEKIGGPSVKIYQPEGLWEDVSFKGDFTAQYYVQDHGENLYRRGMYTFWKRTVPPPMLQTFDAPEREFCIVRRSVTNTPLQALALMNDPSMIEASRKFAERILREGGSTDSTRLSWAYRQVLSRNPNPEEIKVLLGVLTRERVVYARDKTAAIKLLKVGESLYDDKLNAAELAAWTSAAGVLFNLDEAVTKG